MRKLMEEMVDRAAGEVLMVLGEIQHLVKVLLEVDQLKQQFEVAGAAGEPRK
jgi:hypothetical protein